MPDVLQLSAVPALWGLALQHSNAGGVFLLLMWLDSIVSSGTVLL